MCVVIPMLAAAAPTLFGTATATLATTSLAAGVAGAGMSAYGMYQQSAMQKAVAKNNAETAAAQAADAQQRGEQEAQRITRDAAGLKSTQRVVAASHGLDVGFGTAAALQDQTDFFGQWDAATARTSAGKEAWASRRQSANYRAEASSINPAMSAGATLLTQGGQVASNWYRRG